MPRIDKLDLRKKKAELENSREENFSEANPLQQVHVRVEGGAAHHPQQDERRDAWEEVKKINAEEPETPSEPVVHSFAEKIEQKFAKLEKHGQNKSDNNSFGADENVEQPIEHPHQEIAIHSAAPVAEREEAEEVEVRAAPIKKTSTVDLRPDHIKKRREPARVAIKRVFSEKISGKNLTEFETEEKEFVQQENIPPSAAAAYSRSLLSNGLKLILAPIAGTKTVTAMIMFGTGSKYESLSASGLSHFLEHMFFKAPSAARRRKDWLLILTPWAASTMLLLPKNIPAIGLKLMARKFRRRWIFIRHAFAFRISRQRINKERGVIIEEINMYHENPMMYIEEVFESCLYGDSPAGREVLGTKANINAFKRQNF